MEVLLYFGVASAIALLAEGRIMFHDRQRAAREKELLAMLRQLQNRLHARDLSSYMALEERDKRAAGKQPGPATFPAGNDQAEAAAFAAANGIGPEDIQEYFGRVNPTGE